MTQASNQYAGPKRTLLVPLGVASQPAGVDVSVESALPISALLPLSYLLLAVWVHCEVKKLSVTLDVPRLWDLAAVVGGAVAAGWVYLSQWQLVSGVTPLIALSRAGQMFWFSSISLLLVDLCAETSGHVDPPDKLASFNERLRGNLWAAEVNDD